MGKPKEKRARLPVSRKGASAGKIAGKRDGLEPFSTLWNGGIVVESSGTGKNAGLAGPEKPAGFSPKTENSTEMFPKTQKEKAA